MDLNALRYFLVIAEEQHITRAAERLQMAQPNLTRIMRKLEENLGFTLFDRSNKRRFALTPAGETFLQQTIPILKQYEEAVRVARQIAQGARGKLVVGYTSVATFTGVLPPLIQAYQSSLEVELVPRDISNSSRHTVLNMLRAGHLDVVFLPHGSEDPELACELVSTSSLVVALPANHPLASQQAISLAALSQEAWIRPARAINPRWYDDVSLLFQQAGFEPRTLHLVPQAHITVSQVAAGLGLAILATWTQQNLPHQGVVYRPLQGCDYVLEFHVLWRKADRSPRVQAFLQILQEVKAEIGGQDQAPHLAPESLLGEDQQGETILCGEREWVEEAK